MVEFVCRHIARFADLRCRRLLCCFYCCFATTGSGPLGDDRKFGLDVVTAPLKSITDRCNRC